MPHDREELNLHRGMSSTAWWLVGGGLLVLVGQPDMVAELLRRDLGDVLDAVDELARGVRLARALDERDGGRSAWPSRS